MHKTIDSLMAALRVQSQGKQVAVKSDMPPTALRGLKSLQTLLRLQAACKAHLHELLGDGLVALLPLVHQRGPGRGNEGPRSAAGKPCRHNENAAAPS